MKTETFTVDAAGEPEPIVVARSCKEVEIYENAQAGTTDYDVYAPTKNDAPVRRPAGSKTLFKSFEGSWTPGATIGYVATVTGSVSFAKEER